MRKLKTTALVLASVLTAVSFAGCDSNPISISEYDSIVDSETEAVQETDAVSIASTTENSEELANPVEEYDNKDDMDEALGFTTCEIENSAYTPVSYQTIDEEIGEITYNHDGAEAVLRETETETDNLSGVNGTENADTINLYDYDLDIDVQENDNGYVAEWSGVNTDGELRYYSLYEDNSELESFESTIIDYVEISLSDDQSEKESLEAENSSSENGDVDVLESSTNSENEDEDTGIVVGTLDDNLTTYVYEVTENGSYKFTDPVSSNDTYWDIYVLDEQFEDGDRYIPQAYESSGQTPSTLELKKGQWVYCICNKNQWTLGEYINCELTVTKLDK